MSTTPKLSVNHTLCPVKVPFKATETLLTAQSFCQADDFMTSYSDYIPCDTPLMVFTSYSSKPEVHASVYTILDRNEKHSAYALQHDVSFDPKLQLRFTIFRHSETRIQLTACNTRILISSL